ncbi:MAG TPA: YbgC/FadM family acyl-CoA thioesterase [Sphaerochaeta sp.]|jgi:acyl-CoA thioester hydrolase|nr:YbgC/FadM family acyl-CoA thioesterase [Spirochaetota bacterium]NLV60732.1 YbgC/FadM family acyl-CoA thioesterase [Spirochaetales bacterium]HOE84718.1 YbgC/FadM family acyl-CoA thioesterase [Sphaerochaeta sp.]HOQ94790.1 YbgC/FadM family acyl-CoA thioesterase [Sphaerochaeta sp.]HPK46370.1 YbgC/FadM family acyl-CoA thioesterase [Sphaerochaeta sp.]
MHRYRQRVYYSDTDSGGIVYHARYLDFAEHARTEMLREIAVSHQLEGAESKLFESLNLVFVVKSITADYQSPAYLDDLLVVETVAESIKRFSLIFTQTVKRDGEVLCVMRVKVGSLDAVTLRPKAMGEALLAAFAAERHDEED